MNEPTGPAEHLLLLAGDFTRHNDALTGLHVSVRCCERTAIPPGLHFRIPWTTVSLLDIPDVFIGSTDDGHTFVILNRRIRDADRLLTDAGSLPREHHGRRLYLLPPDSAGRPGPGPGARRASPPGLVLVPQAAGGQG
ncbi:hypothetical protein ACPCSQ_23455 [Streptomyces griseoincarnatus]